VSSEFWRGDVWPAPNYQVAKGLAAYGLHAQAARIANLTVANALKAGISERYDSNTGAALGVKGLGMSATVITMMPTGSPAAIDCEPWVLRSDPPLSPAVRPLGFEVYVKFPTGVADP